MRHPWGTLNGKFPLKTTRGLKAGETQEQHDGVQGEATFAQVRRGVCAWYGVQGDATLAQAWMCVLGMGCLRATTFVKPQNSLEADGAYIQCMSFFLAPGAVRKY